MATMLLSGIKRTRYWEYLTNRFLALVVELDGFREYSCLLSLALPPPHLFSLMDAPSFFSLLLGFVFPVMWYYAAFLYLGKYYHRDPRERTGLQASAIAVSFMLLFAHPLLLTTPPDIVILILPLFIQLSFSKRRSLIFPIPFPSPCPPPLSDPFFVLFLVLL